MLWENLSLCRMPEVCNLLSGREREEKLGIFKWGRDDLCCRITELIGTDQGVEDQRSAARGLCAATIITHTAPLDQTGASKNACKHVLLYAGMNAWMLTGKGFAVMNYYLSW